MKTQCAFLPSHFNSWSVGSGEHVDVFTWQAQVAASVLQHLHEASIEDTATFQVMYIGCNARQVSPHMLAPRGQSSREDLT